jgi:hypothetical protein
MFGAIIIDLPSSLPSITKCRPRGRQW